MEKRSSFKRNILWIDGLGGLSVGIIVLLFSDFISNLHQIPKTIIIFMAIANMLYGSYSTNLAMRSKRSLTLIKLLVYANSTWFLVCVYLTIKYLETITLFGYFHFLGEGLYVGFLAYNEWQWRIDLQNK